MTKLEKIVEKLSLFNNLSFTKKQWDIILKGCDCPKSAHFWSALHKHCLIADKSNKRRVLYTLKDMDVQSFASIWEEYCATNRAGALKSYYKAKARKKAREAVNKLKGHTFFCVGGVCTPDNPYKE